MNPGFQQHSTEDEAVLMPPVYDEEEMIPGCASWQLLSVSLHRAPTLGFGIAVSGGLDNPHFTSGDPAVVISDVVPNGPAWGLLQVNDRILSANGVSFESIDYASAVDIIKNADQISMIVKRKVPVPVLEFEQRTLKFTLSKSRKKEDFGIVVGCKFYIKEIRNTKLAEKEPGLREGDSVLRINGQSLEGASLDEVNKWLERSRDKLCLVIQRDVRRGTSRWPSQNTVYERVGSVGATPRHSPSPMMNHQPLSTRSSHEYINSPRWRPDGSYNEERRVSSPAVSASGGNPPINGEYEYYNRQQPKPDSSGIRTVAFRKVGGSVGVRVIGGNEVGIFVSAVAADSPAAQHGVCCGDRIVEVNGRGMRGVTRETAVQLLMSLHDRIVMRLEHARHEFEEVRNRQLGDNFYIRAHFNKDNKKTSPLELSVGEGDIFHITDTLFGGTVGLWQAARVYSANANKGEAPKGVIPNQLSAEVLAQEQRKREADQKTKDKGRGTLLRRLDQRRTKSLPKNLLSDPAELSVSIPLPAYERVALNTPSFHRPVVLFGPLADVARSLLLSQLSARFAEPESDGGVIRLSAVDAIIAAGKHCILDISIESVERLQLAQYAPIVVLIDVDGRSKIRDIRKKQAAPHLSSRKLAEQASQIKKHHSHLLSATVDATQEEGWFDALRDLVVHLQQRRLWMPEFPPNLPLEDVLLFPLSAKTNYDSDVDSVKGDYGDYSLKRDDSLSRVQNSMTRSIYDWDSSQASDVPSSECQMSQSTTLSRKGKANPQINHYNTPPIANPGGPPLIFNNTASGLHATPSGSQSIQLPLSPNKTNEVRQPQSPGYFHVKQLLNDESLYQDARLANEIANVRLREEARMRDERSKDEQRFKMGNQIPLQPPNPEMYSPRDERSATYVQNTFSNNGTGHASRSDALLQRGPSNDRSSQSVQPRPVIAPKPSLYTESQVRNRWNESRTPEPRMESPSLVSQSHSVSQMNGNGTNSGNSLVAGSLRINGSTSPMPPHSPSTLRASGPSPSEMTGHAGRGGASPNMAPLARPEETRTSPKEEDANEEPVVVEETSGVVGSEGAVLRCPNSQVELRIPKGAIAEGESHEIYVKVCREGDSPPIDKSKGETLLSPLVMCGPQGLSFLTPCELHLPHSGQMDSDGQWSFSLKAGEGGEWKHLELDPSTAQSDRQFLSIPITHF